MKRRHFLKIAAGGLGAAISQPAFVRNAVAQGPVKIGVLTALSGTQAIYGEQTKRGVEYFVKEVRDKGGIRGRPVEIVYEDSATDPATAVRKAQKLVEKDGVNFITGLSLSSEALAISPKCAEWGSILISNITGAGALTTTAFNPHFFRINKSAAMGARVTTLYLKDSSMKRFYGLGSDYAYGRDAIASFSKQATAVGKEIVGTAFTPLGTKDFASYIVKVKESGAEGCYFALTGGEVPIFFKQALQFGLTKEVKMIVETLDNKYFDQVGDALEGTIGSARYAYTLDTPKNKKFVAAFYAMHKVYPDYPDAVAYQGLDWLAEVIEKVGTAEDINKIIAGWDDSTYDGLEGPLVMRKCDHQAVQGGYMTIAGRDPNYPHLVPKIITNYPPDQITPKCRTENFD
jgi:branched-chain amino acid transport system substrate-binding protein